MRSPDALASGQADDDYEARPASSKSSTASWLFSATAICAPRASRNTSARARANSSGSPSHHSASDAIASSARPGSPWTYSARYSANDAATRACRRASSCCTASGQLEPVGVCVDILRPPSSQPLEAPRGPRGENSWSGDTSRRRRWLGGDLEPNDLAPLSGNRGSPNRSKGDYADESVEGSTSRAVDAEGERPGRAAESPASHSSRPGAPRTDRTPAGVSPASSSGQADAHRGQEVGGPIPSFKPQHAPTLVPSRSPLTQIFQEEGET
jgi:hypothetical protein